MLKKVMATAAITLTVAAAGATQAMAIGNDEGTTTVNGNGASQVYGNSETHGDLSPQIGLIQGSLNKPCIGLPIKTNTQDLVGASNIAVQDIPILSAPQNQQCVENSTQAKGDEPLSHILSNIPILSGNGSLGS